MAGVLIHEWIATAGGSENVLEAMSRVYPDADILCLWNDSIGRFDPERVHESWLAKSPLRRSKALALPFMPATWRRLQDRDYDWALISSHLFAHHARFEGRALDVPRFVYVHTPARYIWTPELDMRGNGIAAQLAARVLKPLDRRRAGETAHFAANSRFVQSRIADAWHVESRVIHPPVEVTQIQSGGPWRDRLSPQDEAVFESLPAGFILGASRFIPYKRLDTVIRTAELTGRPVVLAGKGSEYDRLHALAAASSVPVYFVIAPSRELLYALYEAAALYVFPAIEDFGIMPVEAMAAGAAVLAQSVGGASESVVSGVTGETTTFESDSDIRSAAERALSTQRDARRAHARTFTAERFANDIETWVSNG
jgi:glycosyltransferase involved in cell wall biosynthesis